MIIFPLVWLGTERVIYLFQGWHLLLFFVWSRQQRTHLEQLDVERSWVDISRWLYFEWLTDIRQLLLERVSLLINLTKTAIQGERSIFPALLELARVSVEWAQVQVHTRLALAVFRNNVRGVFAALANCLLVDWLDEFRSLIVSLKFK